MALYHTLGAGASGCPPAVGGLWRLIGAGTPVEHLRTDEPAGGLTVAEERDEITFATYEQIVAFKQAAVMKGLSRQDTEDVFYDKPPPTA